MKIKNVCGDERGCGATVIGPDEVIDVTNPQEIAWFLKRGCEEVGAAPKPVADESGNGAPTPRRRSKRTFK